MLCGAACRMHALASSPIRGNSCCHLAQLLSLVPKRNVRIHNALTSTLLASFLFSFGFRPKRDKQLCNKLSETLREHMDLMFEQK